MAQFTYNIYSVTVNGEQLDWSLINDFTQNIHRVRDGSVLTTKKRDYVTSDVGGLRYRVVVNFRGLCADTRADFIELIQAAGHRPITISGLAYNSGVVDTRGVFLGDLVEMVEDVRNGSSFSMELMMDEQSFTPSPGEEAAQLVTQDWYGFETEDGNDQLIEEYA